MTKLSNQKKFTQTLATGAAALGVIAGVGMVNAPQASAGYLGPAAGFTSPVTVGDKIFTPISGFAIQSGDQLEIDKDANNGIWDFTYDFLPDYSGNGGQVKYSVQITDPNSFFNQISLSTLTDMMGPMKSVTKLVEWNGGANNYTLTSTDGAPAMFTMPKGIQFITVTDTIVNPNGASMSAFQNSFNQQSVPEPSSVLGLLAFGGVGLGIKAIKRKK